MSQDKAVVDHYTHGALTQAIQAALARLGKTVDTVTIEDLAPVDEFHIGGRQATEQFLAQLDFADRGHFLDVGCGLGGASRFVADKYNAEVTGIDLSQDYIETGNALCAWVGLDKHVTLHQGSALALPFPAEAFDGGVMLHVGMNIVNKTKLFAEIYRVLRPGSSFGVYDIMADEAGEPTFPVPWAADHRTSSLATPDQYRQALHAAGFDVTAQNNRRDFALALFKALREKAAANSGPPPLGLHILMGESTAAKVKNMMDSIAAGYIAPVEMVARKH